MSDPTQALPTMPSSAPDPMAGALGNARLLGVGCPMLRPTGVWSEQLTEGAWGRCTSPGALGRSRTSPPVRCQPILSVKPTDRNV